MCNKNKSFYLLLSLFISCHATPISSSTLVVIWTDANYHPVDIQLNDYYAENNSNKTPPLSTTTTLLATNITFFKNNSYPVEIPLSNLSLLLTYSLIIINSIKGTQLASSGPLNLKTLKTEFPESLLLSSSPPTTATNTYTSISLLVANNSSSSTLNSTFQISSHDIGPTLSSTQVAVIAMGFIGCSGILFLLYFTVKWIIKKRRATASERSFEKKPWQDNHQYDIRDTSLYHTAATTETSVSGSTSSGANNNKNNKKYFTLGNIEEEDYYTSNRNLKYDSRLTPAPRQSSSRSSSPFGEPPQSFNGNRYIPTLPPNAYPHNQ